MLSNNKMIGIYDPNARQGYAIVDGTSGVVGAVLRFPDAIVDQLEQRNPLMDPRLPAFSGNPLEFMRNVEALIEAHGISSTKKPIKILKSTELKQIESQLA